MRRTVLPILASAVFLLAFSACREEKAAGCGGVDTLREAGDCIGRFVGSMLEPASIRQDEAYRGIAAREYNFVTQNGCYWDKVQPTRDAWVYDDADLVTDFASEHGQKIRGHNLIWYLSAPPWVSEDMTADELRAAMRTAVQTTVGRYKGRIYSWDVVNEPFNNDGSLIENLFYKKLGRDYVGEVLAWAHEADPGALLFLNDHSMDEVNGKSDGAYAYIKGLLAGGAPLHGMGLQAHFNALHPPAREKLEANFKRFGDLGLAVDITELDVRVNELSGTMEEKLAAQKRIYYDVAAACAAQPACRAFITWNFTDRDTWLDRVFPPPTYPLPFDEDYNPKPAYYGVLQGLLGLPLGDGGGAPDGGCQARCGDRRCGDDGCGGTCGVCAAGEVCKGGSCEVRGACSAPPGQWPPAIDALFAGLRCAALPACDPSGDPCYDPGDPNEQVVKATTTATDCPEIVATYDKRGKVGNLFVDERIRTVDGTCIKNANGEVIGAVYGGVSATCEGTEQGMGVTAYETAVIDFKDDGKGKATIHLRNLPTFATGGVENCVIEMDVQQTLK